MALSVKSKNPDILIAPGYVDDRALFRQLKDTRFTPKAIGTASPIISNRIFEVLGKDAEGACQHCPVCAHRQVVRSVGAWKNM